MEYHNIDQEIFLSLDAEIQLPVQNPLSLDCLQKIRKPHTMQVQYVLKFRVRVEITYRSEEHRVTLHQRTADQTVGH